VTSSTRAKVGLFVSRDRDALPLWPLLKERGLTPGKEIEVVSCDNDEPLLSMLDPRPPSIDLCPEQIGHRAVARLGGRIREPHDPPFRTLVLPRLVMPSSG
jgi:DNA-binding LacI/PurR family transcriptional regulator